MLAYKKKSTYPSTQASAIPVLLNLTTRFLSESGQDWMELWGLGNQPWEKGFTINAVAAVLIGKTPDFGFAGHTLHLDRIKIELHYLTSLGADSFKSSRQVAKITKNLFCG